MANPYYAWLKGETTYTPGVEKPYKWSSCQDYTDTVTMGEGATSFDNYYRGILSGIFALSFAGLCFVVLTIRGDDRLKAHPQPMIALMCAVEASLNWNAFIQLINPCFFSCYMGTAQLF
jgi:hypothetical protein